MAKWLFFLASFLLLGRPFEGFLPSGDHHVVNRYRADKIIIARLIEEISLGNDEGREGFIGQVGGLDVDEAGFVYIVDMREMRVKVYDNRGSYLLEMGRKGQGPGEFSLPIKIQVRGKEQSIYIFDALAKRIIRYSLKGKYQEQRPLLASGTIMGIAMDSLKRLYVCSTTFETRRMTIYVFDEHFVPIRKLGDYPLIPVNDPFAPRLCWLVNAQDELVLGYPDKYEIIVYDKEGIKVRTLMHDPPPVEVSGREREDAVRAYRFPKPLNLRKYHSAYDGLLCDENGTLYVKTWRIREGITDFDAFSNDGRFIGIVPVKGQLLKIMQGRAYCLEENDDGNEVIKRYRIVWN